MRHGEILDSIRRRHPEYPAGNLTSYLHELQTDERAAILRCGADRRYRFIDPLHHTYAQVTLLPSKGEEPTPTEVEAYLRQALRQDLEVSYSRRMDADLELLTSRERSIFLLALKGYSNRHIAEELGISIRTVDNHLYQVYTKLGIRGRSDLVRRYVRFASQELGLGRPRGELGI
jgi:DNA-binding NarL/FixJ family response regulator